MAEIDPVASSSKAPKDEVRVNRAPVLTLWGAVVAERLGHDRDAALTLGKAVAGLNAVSKGRRLGIYEEPEPEEREAPRAKVKRVSLLGRRIPVARTAEGLRAVRQKAPENPATVARYLERAFGSALVAVRAAMTELAASLSKAELEKRAYALYEQFRPKVPEGAKGWGAKGTLDLAGLEKLAARPRTRRGRT